MSMYLYTSDLCAIACCYQFSYFFVHHFAYILIVFSSSSSSLLLLLLSSTCLRTRARIVIMYERTKFKRFYWISRNWLILTDQYHKISFFWFDFIFKPYFWVLNFPILGLQWINDNNLYLILSCSTLSTHSMSFYYVLWEKKQAHVTTFEFPLCQHNKMLKAI